MRRIVLYGFENIPLQSIAPRSVFALKSKHAEERAENPREHTQTYVTEAKRSTAKSTALFRTEQDEAREENPREFT